MNKSHILWGCLSLLTLTSCFKDEAPNAECDITQAWLHADDPSEMFYQASDSLVNVLTDKTDIRFSVKRKADITALAPRFTTTPGAIVEPANGSVHDFSQGPVSYRVTSADHAWHRDYTVSVVPVTKTVKATIEYDFETYHLDSYGEYYIWSEDENGVATDVWATGNGGFEISNSSAKPDEYPTIPLDNSLDGKGVRLVTRAKQFTGYYRYTPGPKFQNQDGSYVDGKQDTPSIYAILYRNHDAQGNAVTLNGENVQTSPLIVARAIATDLPATTEWRQFQVNFTFDSDLDLDLLENRGYSLAVVFSSSADGAYFQGAVNSTLDIDKVRIVCETQE